MELQTIAVTCAAEPKRQDLRNQSNTYISEAGGRIFNHLQDGVLDGGLSDVAVVLTTVSSASWRTSRALITRLIEIWLTH